MSQAMGSYPVSRIQDLRLQDDDLEDEDEDEDEDDEDEGDEDDEDEDEEVWQVSPGTTPAPNFLSFP